MKLSTCTNLRMLTNAFKIKLIPLVLEIRLENQLFKENIPFELLDHCEREKKIDSIDE